MTVTRPAPVHIEYTVDVLVEELRGIGDDNTLALAADRDLLRIIATAARKSVGVCSDCDGDGSRRLQPGETDVGPEDCPHCEGHGWLVPDLTAHLEAS